MANRMENIIEYYVETIAEEHKISKKEAMWLLEDVLEDNDIEQEILERTCTIS